MTECRPDPQTKMHTPIVVFDGICHFCSSSVRFILRHDVNRVIHFAPLQSKVGRQLLELHEINPDDAETFLFIDQDSAYIRSDAALEIARYLGHWSWLRFLRFLPRSIRDAAYGLLARNRYRWFGRRDTCFVPAQQDRIRFIDVA